MSASIPDLGRSPDDTVRLSSEFINNVVSNLALLRMYRPDAANLSRCQSLLRASGLIDGQKYCVALFAVSNAAHLKHNASIDRYHEIMLDAQRIIEAMFMRLGLQCRLTYTEAKVLCIFALSPHSTLTLDVPLLLTTSRRVVERILRETSVCFACGLSGIYPFPDQLTNPESNASCFSEAHAALSQRLFDGSMSVCAYPVLPERRKVLKMWDFSGFEQKLTECFINPDKFQFSKLFDSVFDGELAGCGDPEYVDLVCRQIQIIIWHYVHRHGHTFIVLRSLTTPYYDDILEIDTLAERKEWVLSLCTTFCSSIEFLRFPESCDANVHNAIIYIFKNSHENIELPRIATEVGLSPNYFSTIFKSQTGHSFKSFLNHVRVEKAREYLLSTDYKISEIAFRVGIGNSKHFSQVFKEHLGKSPSDVRREARSHSQAPRSGGSDSAGA